MAKEEYRSPTGHSFKDKEFSTCFDILVEYISNLRPLFENGEASDTFEHIIYAELEKTKCEGSSEEEPNLTDAEMCLLIRLRDKIGGWVSLKDRANPKYLSIPSWTKEFEKWRKLNGLHS